MRGVDASDYDDDMREANSTFYLLLKGGLATRMHGIVARDREIAVVERRVSIEEFLEQIPFARIRPGVADEQVVCVKAARH